MSGEIYTATGFRPMLRHITTQGVAEAWTLGISKNLQGMPAPLEDYSRSAAVWLGSMSAKSELPVLAVTIPKGKRLVEYGGQWFVGLTDPETTELLIKETDDYERAKIAINTVEHGPNSLFYPVKLLKKLISY